MKELINQINAIEIYFKIKVKTIYDEKMKLK